MTNHKTRFLNNIARRRLTKTEALPELARAMNINTLQLIEMLESDQYTEALNNTRTIYADYIAEETGVEIIGNSPAERFKHAVKHSKELRVFSRSPWA